MGKGLLLSAFNTSVIQKMNKFYIGTALCLLLTILYCVLKILLRVELMLSVLTTVKNKIQTEPRLYPEQSLAVYSTSRGQSASCVAVSIQILSPLYIHLCLEST